MNLLLTADNDLAIIDGSLKKVTGAEEIAQKIKQVLLASEGDWFLDLEQGLPFFQTIFLKATSVSAIESIYLDAIGSVPGVIDIVSFRLDYDPSTREASITFKVNTSDGVLDFNLEV